MRFWTFVVVMVIVIGVLIALREPSVFDELGRQAVEQGIIEGGTP